MNHYSSYLLNFTELRFVKIKLDLIMLPVSWRLSTNLNQNLFDKLWTSIILIYQGNGTTATSPMKQ